MNIVSGLTTAQGIAPLLNAPRETQQNAPSDSTDQTHRAPDATTGNVVSLHARPATSVSNEANSARSPNILESNDDRYTRFVKAVQALRIDPAGEILNDRRVAELIDAAEGFFLVDDGIPREVQPLPPDPSIRVEPLAPDPEPEFPESVIDERLAKAEAETEAEEAKQAETTPPDDAAIPGEDTTDEATQAPRDPFDEEPREERARQREEVEAAAQQARAQDAAQRDQRIADAEAKKRQDTSPVEE